MIDRQSAWIGRSARIAAVAFALFVLGWLVVNAQRNANRNGAEPVPVATPPATAAPAPTTNGIAPAPAPEFLFSSKSVVIDKVLGDPDVGPVEKVTPPPVEPVFLPSSKVGAPGVVPPLRSASAPGTAPAKPGKQPPDRQEQRP